MTDMSAIAKKRLASDMRRLHKEPVPYVAARLDEDDCLLVHVNMLPADGPYAGVPVHLHLSFPPDYPLRPPTLLLKTPLRHPNIFFIGPMHENSMFFSAPVPTAQQSDPESASKYKTKYFVCLDMLREAYWFKDSRRGWSAAYDLPAILRQLYGFLLADNKIDQDYGNSSRERSKYVPTAEEVQHAHAVRCSCGFLDLPAATLPPHVAAESAAAGSSVAALKAQTVADCSSSSSSSSSSSTGNPTMTTSGTVQMPELPLDLLPSVLQSADANTIAACAARGCDTDALAAAAHARKCQLEQQCFFLKEACNEDTILGVGVAVQYHARSRDIKGLSMSMDLLSHQAFSLGVRRSAWNEPFQRFLPLALNRRHAQRALPALLNHYLDKLTNSDCATTAQERCPKPPVAARLLTVLAQLLNSLAVEMVQTDHTKLRRHMSDAALRSFCHLHHLLLSVVTLRPQLGAELMQQAQRDVLEFVRNPAARHKSCCPDLGVLLIKLLLVPKDVMPWQEFAPAFLRELLARQVLWLKPQHSMDPIQTPWQGLRTRLRSVRKRACSQWIDEEDEPSSSNSSSSNNCGSSCASIDSCSQGTALPAGVPAECLVSSRDDDEHRLTRTFTGAATGLRLVALEAWFANALARPQNSANAAAQLAAVCAAYDARGGSPPDAIFHRFHAHAHRLLRITKWSSVLGALHLGLRAGSPLAAKQLMANLLRQAAVDSHRAQYHKTSGSPPSWLVYEAWCADAPPVAVIDPHW